MDRIGRYVVVGRLGSGGFATVYHADDPILQLPVAVKVLADNAAHDPELRARFINEARVMRRLGSARIATVYDIAELPDGRPYLVMQLAGRGTLHDRVQQARAQGRPVSVADLWAVVRGLGDALAVVHDAGVVHRDVKPSNVLVDLAPAGVAPDQPGQGILVRRDELLMLADFGLAKNLAETRRMTLAAGTTAYMAPEQRRIGAPVDGRTDIYAASAVVAELAATAAAAAPVAPEWLPAMRAALDRGMAEEPDARPRDAQAWSSELAAILPEPAPDGVPAARGIAPPPGQPASPYAGSAGPGPPSAEAVSPDAEPTSPHPSRRRWRSAGLAAGLGAVLLAGAVVASLAWLPGDPGPTIVGPRELAVGQEGVYYADVDPGTSLTWTGPGDRTEPGGELAVRAGQVGTFTVAVRTDGGDQSTITVTVSAADDTVGVEGPSRARVGDTALFRPDVPPGTRTYWRDGDGVRRDSATLTVRFTGPGTMTVSLVADLAGVERTVSHPVTVLP